MLAQHPEVVLAERRRLMDEARALAGGDVVVRHHDERAAPRFVLEVGEERLVGAPHQVRTFEFGEGLQVMPRRVGV